MVAYLVLGFRRRDWGKWCRVGHVKGLPETYRASGFGVWVGFLEFKPQEQPLSLEDS